MRKNGDGEKGNARKHAERANAEVSVMFLSVKSICIFDFSSLGQSIVIILKVHTKCFVFMAEWWKV